MNNDLKVIVFNAPARSGKDIAAAHMTDTINNSGSLLAAHHREFKHSLIKITSDFLGITVSQFLKGYNETVEEHCKRMGYNIIRFTYNRNVQIKPNSWWKDVPIYTPTGDRLSKRETLIHVSENVIKPNFGEDAFGKMFVNNLPEEGVVFVSDGGFPQELLPVINHVGKYNVLVVRIHREGCDFSNDSRDYLEEDMFDKESQPKFIDIENNGTIEEFLGKVEEVFKKWESST